MWLFESIRDICIFNKVEGNPWLLTVSHWQTGRWESIVNITYAITWAKVSRVLSLGVLVFFFHDHFTFCIITLAPVLSSQKVQMTLFILNPCYRCETGIFALTFNIYWLTLTWNQLNCLVKLKDWSIETSNDHYFVIWTFSNAHWGASETVTL